MMHPYRPAAAQPTKAGARAHPNIALVKYWGKRDADLNLPARGSLSLTLDGLWAETEVEWVESLERDRLVLDGREERGAGLARARRLLDRVREVTGSGLRASVRSRANFPAAAGLASSSAGFAALAVAAAAAAGWDAGERELSALARLGSGSACRSIPGGFAEWLPGRRSDGEDSVAVQIAPPDWWDVRIVVALVAGGTGRKAVSSADGMALTAQTSPFYRPFLDSLDADLVQAREGILERDLEKVGETMERSTLRMHAACMASDPPILYWLPETVALIGKTTALRGAGAEAYFTVDAGPHVKVLCRAADAETVREALAGVPGVAEAIVCAVGGAARRVDG